LAVGHAPSSGNTNHTPHEVGGRKGSPNEPDPAALALGDTSGNPGENSGLEKAPPSNERQNFRLVVGMGEGRTESYQRNNC